MYCSQRKGSSVWSSASSAEDRNTFRAKLLEYLQSPLHRAYLMLGKDDYRLHGMEQAVIQQKYAAAFQPVVKRRFQPLV